MATKVTFGPYENTGFNVDSHTGNTEIVDNALTGGGPAGSWIGFYVTITAGTGSGSALITGWNDTTDAITVGAGLSDVTDNDTFKITCRYTTCKDNYVTSAAPTRHGGTDTELFLSYDGYKAYPIFYFDVDQQITAGSTIDSAAIYLYQTTEYYSGEFLAEMEKLKDGSGSPDNVLWDEEASGYNKAATWNYKDHDTTTDWEADSSTDFEDVLSGVFSSDNYDVNGANGWNNLNIQAIVEDWVKDSEFNLGLCLSGRRDVEPNDSYAKIASKEHATSTYRWFAVVEWTAAAGGGVSPTGVLYGPLVGSLGGPV